MDLSVEEIVQDFIYKMKAETGTENPVIGITLDLAGYEKFHTECTSKLKFTGYTTRPIRVYEEISYLGTKVRMEK